MKWIFAVLTAFFAVLTTNVYSTELPVESFSRLPKFKNLKLSPDGSQIAYITNYQKEGLSLLTTYHLTSNKQSFLVKSDNEEVKINWFGWANNKTLLVSVRYAAKRYGTDTTETRLVAIEADGSEKESRELIRPRTGTGMRGGDHVSQFQDQVIDYLPDDPDHVVIALDLDKPNQPSVYKLNIYTRKLSRLEKGKRKIRQWLTDQQGNVRLGRSLDYKTGEAIFYVRQVGSKEWERLFEYNALNEPRISASGFALDPDVLYFKRYKGDKKALYKIKLSTGEEELVFEDPDYDVDGGLIYSRKTRDVIGLYHGNTNTGRIYWDKGRQRLQDGLDHALPDTDNYLTSFSSDEQRYILYTENDYTPGSYYFGDRETGSITFLLSQYPELPSEVLTEHKLVTYTARDGMKIEGYLTLPKDHSGPVATIIHPHGGPGARDMDGFDYWTSFFSNRGYAVFRPNFRGSSGYGYSFAQSQMKGWGLEMQDDLTDAARWLISEDVSNPDKICIVGGSYGGYAAAMGLAKTPDLFKCGVSFAGVSNLKRLLIKSRNYTSSKFVKNQLGNDYDDLEKRSPYYLVEKFKSPLLLVHGEDDRVVDVEQSRELADELSDIDKPVEYLELENGDHYLSIQRNRHAFFKAMDEFLKQHLK